MMSMTDFKRVSLNVQGLRSLNKRKAILTWLIKQKADIVFLQETYSSSEDENFWNTQWEGKMLFSHGSNHSKGTLVLVKQGLDFEQKIGVMRSERSVHHFRGCGTRHPVFLCKHLRTKQNSRTGSFLPKD